MQMREELVCFRPSTKSHPPSDMNLVRVSSSYAYRICHGGGSEGKEAVMIYAFSLGFTN